MMGQINVVIAVKHEASTERFSNALHHNSRIGQDRIVVTTSVLCIASDLGSHVFYGCRGDGWCNKGEIISQRVYIPSV